jgi:transcription termination/antitermination protein NusA
MNGDFLDALRQIEKEKDIPMETLIETIESAIASAYKKAFSEAAEIRLRQDPHKRGLRLVCEKEIVETVENPHREMSLADAQRRNPAAQIGETIDVDLTADGFGRIAAQTAKQVVVQRIREAEREKVFEDFSDRIGEVVTGTIQRKEQRNAFVALGKVEALLPYSEQVPSEPYRFNDRLKVYVLEVKRTSKGPQVIVSRTHPSLIRRLFELEVPEIADGIVTIKSVAREPGARSKIAVASSDEKVDPVGACVGHRGSRVQAVVTELFGEKIDIVRWSASVPDYITAALQPAKVMSVTVNEEAKSAFVVVPDNQLSLAIGKEGQNVRLAARLTGWRIDIRSETQVRERLQHEMESAQAELAAATAAEPPLQPVGGAEAASNNHTGEPHALEAEGLPADGAEPRVEEPTDVEVMR